MSWQVQFEVYVYLKQIAIILSKLFWNLTNFDVSRLVYQNLAVKYISHNSISKNNYCSSLRDLRKTKMKRKNN